MLHSWVETPTPPNPNPPDPNPHWVSLYSVSQQYLLSSADNVYTSFSVSFELFKLVYMFNTVLNLYFEPLVSPTREDREDFQKCFTGNQQQQQRELLYSKQTTSTQLIYQHFTMGHFLNVLLLLAPFYQSLATTNSTGQKLLTPL